MLINPSEGQHSDTSLWEIDATPGR